MRLTANPSNPEKGPAVSDHPLGRRNRMTDSRALQQLATASGWTLVYHVPRSQVWERSRGRQSGGLHLHATEPFERGRLRRQPGQSLCGKHGWYERPVQHVSDLAVRCGECVRRAQRHGIPWPPAADLAEQP
jgi:hypothetical protein